MLNSDSYRLTIEERNKMINNKDIMDFYVKDYKMFLKFLGINWNIEKLELENYKQFNKCLRINTQLVKIKKVLASLSVLGQREEALKLLKLIHKETSFMALNIDSLCNILNIVYKNKMKNYIFFKQYNTTSKIIQQMKIIQRRILKMNQEQYLQLIILMRRYLKQRNNQVIKIIMILYLQKIQVLLNKTIKTQSLYNNMKQQKDSQDQYSYSSNNDSFDRYQINYKRPQFKQNQYEKFEVQFKFEEIKNNYVQGDYQVKNG
ncbi:unnamed protein product [Paramecium sonneborni]|uniref:Opioid growth factor receptor (OGFr) conserved domain-containing protein n=1 Tax=Paramecium sonneborni TaxID=65129 RepID=A0A8S1RQ48_9CILI|nr:unnamed protein product [Paramecium sonneborni]